MADPLPAAAGLGRGAGLLGVECGLDVDEFLHDKESIGDAAEAKRLVDVGHRLVQGVTTSPGW